MKWPLRITASLTLALLSVSTLLATNQSMRINTAPPKLKDIFSPPAQFKEGTTSEAPPQKARQNTLTSNASDTKKNLSLQVAVLYALHHNPDLQVSINQRKLQHYELITAENKFRPQFSIGGSVGYTRSVNSSGLNIQRTASLGPSVSWNFPLGTQLSASTGFNPSSTASTGSSNSTSTTKYLTWSISLTQPLLQGFGTDINEVDLRNAQDQQKIDSLTLEQKVVSTIIQVTEDYYSVVQAKQSLAISQATLKTNQKTLFNRQQLLKAGRIPENDLTQAQLDVSSQELAVNQAQQTLTDAKQTLLQDLGLPDNTDFTVESQVNFDQVKPNYKQTLDLALKNNRTYKIAKLNYKQSERKLLSDKDQLRWKLDLKATYSHHVNYDNGSSFGDQGLSTTDTRTLNNNSSVSLDLTIPLNHVDTNKKILSAAMDKQNAQITMQKAIRSLHSDVKTTLTTLNSSWQELQTSQQQLKLSEKSYKVAQIKFNYGKIDAFTLSQQQTNLTQAKVNLVKAQISYLKAIMNYQKLTGTLLEKWGIHLENA